MTLKSQIESILFLQGIPTDVAKLAKITGSPRKEIERVLDELTHEYQNRGIILLEVDGKWQFATNPENRDMVKKLRATDLSGDISKSGLEVLAIVAYRGPVSRATIEYIRGVDSSSAIRTLAIRGLIERHENPKDKRSFLYRIGTDFLKHLGLRRVSELPDYEALRKIDVPEPPRDEIININSKRPIQDKYRGENSN